MRKVPTAALMASVAMLLAAPSSFANDTECVGTVTGAQDNIVVPPGQTCTVTGATVAGSIKALEDSRLFVRDNPLIRGNVIGDKAEVVQVFNNPRIDGNIEIEEGETADTGVLDVSLSNNLLTEGNIKIEKMAGEFVVGNGDVLGPLCTDVSGGTPVLGNTLQKGSIQVFENRTVLLCGLQVRANTVAQDLQVFKTTGTVQKLVTANEIRQNLQCFENDQPFVGQPNAVGGNADGQCGQP